MELNIFLWSSFNSITRHTTVLDTGLVIILLIVIISLILSQVLWGLTRYPQTHAWFYGEHAWYIHALLLYRKEIAQLLASKEFPLSQRGTIIMWRMWEEITCELLTHQVTLCVVCILLILAVLSLLILGSGCVKFCYQTYQIIQVLNNASQFTTNSLPAFAPDLWDQILLIHPPTKLSS